jgi:hypothetical protein
MNMIDRSKKSRATLAIAVAVLFALMGMENAARAEENAPKAVGPLPVPKSVFIIPTNVKEGRDPFFPNSSRAPGSEQVQVDPHSNVMSLLILNGLNLKPGGHTAMINGHTMAEGETADIMTSSGTISVHCVKITDGNTVIVEVGSKTQELHMRNE